MPIIIRKKSEDVPLNAERNSQRLVQSVENGWWNISPNKSIAQSLVGVSLDEETVTRYIKEGTGLLPKDT